MHQALGEVLGQFGSRIVDHPDQLRAALADVLGVESVERQHSIAAVVAVAAAGIAGSIRGGGAATPAQFEAWLDQLGAEGVSRGDAAAAITDWATVLGAHETARRLAAGSAVATVALPPFAPAPPPTAVSAPGPPTGIDPYQPTVLARGPGLPAPSTDATILVPSPPAGAVPPPGYAGGMAGSATASGYAATPPGYSGTPPGYPVAPPGYPVSPPGYPTPASGPPAVAPQRSGPGVTSPAPAVARSGRSGLRGWWPTLAASLVVVLTVAVTIPLLVHNLGSVEPRGQRVTEGVGYPSLAGADRAQLVLDIADLRTAVSAPTGELAAVPWPETEFSQPWIKKVSGGCGQALAVAPPRASPAGNGATSTSGSVAYGSGAWNDDRTAYSTARAYPSDDAADYVFLALQSSVQCYRFDVTVAGGVIPSEHTLLGADKGQTVQGYPWRAFRDHATLHGQADYTYERWCAVVSRLVVCHVVLGTGVPAAAGPQLAALGLARLNLMVGYRPDPPPGRPR